LQALQEVAARTLPSDVLIDYAGPLRQYVQESSGFVVTFGLALIIIFLSLAALFESFRDPVVILISIPMSVAGALLFINLGLGGATLNIYTEVGLVTLMGLISKHGILIVEVANEAQRAGRTKLDAVIYAAGIRLRPILMTTAAMVLGVVPLIFASGAGAASRFAMGLVIASGLSIGTLFTLFVLPAVYMMVAARHKEEKVGREVEALTSVQRFNHLLRPRACPGHCAAPMGVDGRDMPGHDDTGTILRRPTPLKGNAPPLLLVRRVQQPLPKLRIGLRGPDNARIFLHRQPMRLDRLHRLGIGAFRKLLLFLLRSGLIHSRLILLLQVGDIT
jgi:hypothetical protein